MADRSKTAAVALVLGIGLAVGIWLASPSDDPAPPATLEETDLAVEVVNGCGVSGAADRVASILRRAGYRVERVGNADHFHYREDLVVARRVERSRVRKLGLVLGDVEVVEQFDPDAEVDVTVIVARPRPLIPEPDGS